MSLAVVGTDTGVGKTVVSALTLIKYAPLAPAGRRLAYWKPVATGGSRDTDVAFIKSRVGDLPEVLREEHCFDPPVSPHLAARQAGVEISVPGLLAAWERLRADPARSILIEGVGGLLVPLNDRGDLLADFLRSLHIPAVLVVRTELGTINHTLLTLEALRWRGIEIAGVVMDGPPHRENREAIERFGEVRVVSEVTPLAGRSPSRAALLAAAKDFDPEGLLADPLFEESVDGV